MDHLVFASRDLDEGVRYVEGRLGVDTSPGGRHLGFGTRNRLVGLGPDAYLEIVAVDPDQAAPGGPRWFDLDEIDDPRLVTWCAKAADLDDAVARGRALGIDLGEPKPGSRARADGTALTWTMTDPWAERAGGVVPFLIDWGESPHPGSSLPTTCRLSSLRLVHPDPALVSGWLDALGVSTAMGRSLVVGAGEAPRVIATLETPIGTVELS